jgi:hypothetical protein
MPSLSPRARRAPAIVLLGLLLCACTSRPCPSERDLGIVAAGQLDYVFEDGTTTSADLGDSDSRMGVSATGALVRLSWHAPASSGGATEPNFELRLTLPDASGTFELGDVAAKVCACKTGSVSVDGLGGDCMLDWHTSIGRAECRVPAGKLQISHFVDGECASRGGCLRNTIIEVVLDKDAKKGILGHVSFVDDSEHEQSSCVSSPLFG